MLIKSISLSDFRGVRETKDKINFTEFTVLIGRNNSGKTSILEALSLFSIPFSGNPNYNIPITGVSKLDFFTELHGHYNSILYGYTGEAKITYSINNSEVIFLLKESKNNFQVIWNSSSFGLSEINRMSEEVVNYFKIIDIEHENSGGKVIYIPNNQAYYQKISEILQGQKNIIVKEGLNVEIVRDLITEWIDDNYTEIFFTPELEVRKEYDGKHPLYIKLKDQGLGVQKVALIALYLALFEPKLILIDDIEASIHPSLLKAFMKWLSNRNCQVIISTHSIDVLNYLLELDIKNSSVLEIYKAEDVVHSNTLGMEELDDYFNSNIDIRNTLGKINL